MFIDLINYLIKTDENSFKSIVCLLSVLTVFYSVNVVRNTHIQNTKLPQEAKDTIIDVYKSSVNNISDDLRIIKEKLVESSRSLEPFIYTDTDIQITETLTTNINKFEGLGELNLTTTKDILNLNLNILESLNLDDLTDSNLRDKLLENHICAKNN